MDAQQIYDQIQQLPLMAGGIRRKESEAIQFLQKLYKQVTGNTVYAGCKGCHIKAANYLTSLTYQNLLTMSEQKFKLKKGVSIEWPYRSGQRITAGNLTDAKAAEFLYNHPKGIDHFEEYPQNENGLDLEEWYPSEKPEVQSSELIDEAPREKPKTKRKVSG